MEKQRNKERKKHEIYFRICEKVQNMREKSSLPEKWNSSDLATMIRWYRHKGNAKILTTVAEWHQRYIDVSGHGDQPVPGLVATDEDDIVALEAGDHEITVTVVSDGIEITATDAGDNEFAASDNHSSEALVLQHGV